MARPSTKATQAPPPGSRIDRAQARAMHHGWAAAAQASSTERSLGRCRRRRTPSPPALRTTLRNAGFLHAWGPLKTILIAEPGANQNPEISSFFLIGS